MSRPHLELPRLQRGRAPSNWFLAATLKPEAAQKSTVQLRNATKTHRGHQLGPEENHRFHVSFLLGTRQRKARHWETDAKRKYYAKVSLGPSASAGVFLKECSHCPRGGQTDAEGSTRFLGPRLIFKGLRPSVCDRAPEYAPMQFHANNGVLQSSQAVKGPRNKLCC